MRTRLFICILLLLQGCSERQFYEGIQDTRKSRCYELPTNQRAQCFEQLETLSYDDYRRELKKIQAED